MKTSLVIYNKGKNCENFHPPLNRILLTKFKKCNKLNDYNYKPWTKLDKNQYWDLISLIEKRKGEIDRKLEQYWSPFN